MSTPNPNLSKGKGKSLMAETTSKVAEPTPTMAPEKPDTPIKRKKRKSASSETYTTYIVKVLRQMKPPMRINRRAASIMNSFVLDAFERIAMEAGKLCTYTKKDTMTSSEITSAVRLVLPGELATCAISEGVSAVQTYNEAITKKSKDSK